MLRALGVPARLVAGYAEGTWNPEESAYDVISKDSHAWPEVYFPKIGWVPFEPTVSQPSSSFPQGSNTDTASSSNPNIPMPVTTVSPPPGLGDERANRLLEEEAARRGQISSSTSGWTLALLAVVVIVAVLVLLEWRRRRLQDLPLPSWLEKTLDERGFRTPGWLRLWSRRSLRTPMENLFANVAWMLRVWGQRIDPTLTPAEQVDALVNTVPALKDDAMTLLEEYHRAMYSPYPANILRARRAVDQIRAIGYRNWVMRLVGLES